MNCKYEIFNMNPKSVLLFSLAQGFPTHGPPATWYWAVKGGRVFKKKNKLCVEINLKLKLSSLNSDIDSLVED